MINSKYKVLDKHKTVLNNIYIPLYYTAFMCISKIYKDIHKWLPKCIIDLDDKKKDFVKYFIAELNKDENLVYEWVDKNWYKKTKWRLIDWRDKKWAHLDSDFDFTDIEWKLIRFKDIKELYLVTGALLEVLTYKYNYKIWEMKEHITWTQELFNDLEKWMK